MSVDLVQALRELEREKGISFDVILRGLEEAMASAYKSWRGISDEEEGEPRQDVRVSLDTDTGEWHVFLQQIDEEGTVTSEEEVEAPEDFKGRIAAQTAKQVILQKLRDAEREQTYAEFHEREGDIVTGIIQPIARDGRRPQSTLLDLGKGVEALLPQAEQVPAESYKHGDRLKAFVVEVNRREKGPQIVVSRSHPGLLRKLFELEVPEIEESIVEIKAVAREPGHRSKIAVASNEPAVDPVGACVGPKGSRVRMVVNELRGEKIDVVPWSADPAAFVGNALQPAKVKEVRIDPESQTAIVIVPDYQLSLAIGKEGQNARLAARLTGWRIDIKSETQAADEARAPQLAPPPTPVVPGAVEAASPEGAPEMAAEAGGPTEEPQPAPTGAEEAGVPAEGSTAQEAAVDAELPPGADEYVADADALATSPSEADGDGSRAEATPEADEDAPAGSDEVAAREERAAE